MALRWQLFHKHGQFSEIINSFISQRQYSIKQNEFGPSSKKSAFQVGPAC